MTDPCILVPASSASQISNLLPLVRPLALARQWKITLLHVALPTRERRPPLEEDLKWLDGEAEKLRAQGLPVDVLHQEGHNAAGVIRETVEALAPELLALTWSRPIGRLTDDSDVMLQDLLLDVPCDLVVWRGFDHAPEPKRILISSAGGPNARLAMTLAAPIRDAYQGEITLLSVLPDTADNETVENAHAGLKRAATELIEQDGGGEIEALGISVVKGSSAAAGILDACASSRYDLLMIGASREGVLNRLVFGQITERVARKAEIPVLVIKRPPPRGVTVARRAWDSVRERTPSLSEAEKIEAYRAIRRSARANQDFYTMIALSTAIAAFGLLLDSPAVVIGAMLVAPLMSAIVALGLAVVQGDAKLLQLSANTTARGVFVTVSIAFMTGLLIPGDAITSEMLARASPSLLDLAVALASGAAGAYALCRKDVSTSLPGVAIAVALAPPLATVGLALAAGAWTIAGGASLLFLTNLVAIAAMGGFVFLLLGFQPEPGRSDRMRLFARGWGGLILVLVTIALLLAWFTFRTTVEAEMEDTLRHTVEQALAEQEDLTLRHFEMAFVENDVVQVSLEIEAARDVPQGEMQALQQRLVAAVGRTVVLTIKLIPTTTLPPLAPSPSSSRVLVPV